MQPDDLLLECQDLLLDLGADEALRNQVPMALRLLARDLPVFGLVSQIPMTWWFGQWIEGVPLTAVDRTAALLAGTPQSITSNPGDGYLLGFYGLLDSLILTIGQVQVGGENNYVYTYFDGHAWQPLTVLSAIDWTLAGAQTLRFTLPDTWEQGTPPEATFTSDTSVFLFWIRIQYMGTAYGTPPSVSAMTAFPPLYPLHPEIIRLLATLYYPTELEPVLVEQSLDFWNADWRTLASTPAYVTQGITEVDRLRLVPAPTVLGSEGIPLFSGDTLAATSGPNNLVLIEILTPDVQELPLWAEGLLILRLVETEARRETDSQDLPLAGAMSELRQSLEGILRDFWSETGLELDSGSAQHITGVHYNG